MSALILFLYVLQAVLFGAPPASAQTDELPQVSLGVGCIALESETAEVVVTVEEGFRVYIIDSDKVCWVKIGLPGAALA